MLSGHDLEQIRAIVREELRALQHNAEVSNASPPEDEPDDDAIREDVRQLVAWSRRERPHAVEYAAARAAFRRGEPGAENRWHAVRLVEARDELQWARANNYSRFITTATRKISILERETPKPYVYRPRKKKP